jgi:two-component system, OmpR family, sensor histidine kinase TctE
LPSERYCRYLQQPDPCADSHQMRTPLAILLTHLDLLGRLGTGSPEGRAALADAEEGARRLERLIAQLLALARADEQ